MDEDKKFAIMRAIKNATCPADLFLKPLKRSAIEANLSVSRESMETSWRGYAFLVIEDILLVKNG